MKKIIKILLLSSLILSIPLSVVAKNVETKVSFLKGGRVKLEVRHKPPN